MTISGHSNYNDAAEHHEQEAARILDNITKNGWAYGDKYRMQVQDVQRAQAHAALALSYRLADCKEGPPA